MNVARIKESIELSLKLIPFALYILEILDKKYEYGKPKGHEHLVISPYPEKYKTTWRLEDGRTVILRPIKPEDEPLWLEMFRHFSESNLRYSSIPMVAGLPIAKRRTVWFMLRLFQTSSMTP